MKYTLCFVFLYNISLFSQTKIDSIVYKRICNCVSKVVEKKITIKKDSNEINKCIDNEIMSYKAIIKTKKKLFKEKKYIEISTNKKSPEYILEFSKIKKKLEDLPILKSYYESGNNEKKCILSKNKEALEHYSKALGFSEKNKCHKAIFFYKKAVKSDSKFTIAWNGLASCYWGIGERNKALNAYYKSLEISPYEMTPLMNIPTIYLEQNKYFETIKSSLRLAEFKSSYSEIYYRIGHIYYWDLKLYDMSLENMCKAYKLYTEQNSTYINDALEIINLSYTELVKNNKEELVREIFKRNNILLE